MSTPILSRSCQPGVNADAWPGHTVIADRTPRPRVPSVSARGARLGAVLALGALLAGCALPQRPQRPAVYDFGPGGLAAPSAPGRPALATPMPGPMALAPMALAEVEATAALEGTALLYRLAYVDARQLRPYAHARWSMAPAQLLHQRLRERLGREAVVLPAGDPAAARELRIELEEFSHVFDSARDSAGLVRLRVTVVAAGTGPGMGRGVVPGSAPVQRSVTVRRPAPSPDAPGGVQALAVATDAAVDEVVEWLRALR